MSETPMSPFGGVLHAFLESPSNDWPPYTHAWAGPVYEVIDDPVSPRPLKPRERDRLARRIARAFDVPLWVVGLSRPPSRVANAAYRQRQKNRVKRRRR